MDMLEVWNALPEIPEDDVIPPTPPNPMQRRLMIGRRRRRTLTFDLVSKETHVQRTKHLVILPELPKRGPSAVGEIPVDSVSYQSLNLDTLEDEFIMQKPVDEQFRSLRNYLTGLKKGPGNSKFNTAFSIIPAVKYSGQIFYYLEIDPKLLTKLSKTLPSSEISSELEIRFKWSDINVSSITGLYLDQDLARSPYKFVADFVRVSDMVKVKPEDGGGRILLTPTLLPVVGTQLPLSKAMFDQAWSLPSTLEFCWKVKFKWTNHLLPIFKEVPKLDAGSILQKMYEMEDTVKDLSIVAANGAEVKCHRVVLMAQSTTFHSMLSPTCGMLESQTGRIEMRENSEEGICAFVQSLYGLEISLEEMTADQIVELLQLANKYEIVKLEEIIKEFLLLKGVDFFTPDTILELFFYTRNVDALEELKFHALGEMSNLRAKELFSGDYYKSLGDADVTFLFQCLKEWN